MTISPIRAFFFMRLAQHGRGAIMCHHTRAALPLWAVPPRAVQGTLTLAYGTLDSEGPPRQRRKCRARRFRSFSCFLVWGCFSCCLLLSVPGGVSFGSCLPGVRALVPFRFVALPVPLLPVFFGVFGRLGVGFGRLLPGLRFRCVPGLLRLPCSRLWAFLFAGSVGLLVALSSFRFVARLCLPGVVFRCLGVPVRSWFRPFVFSALSRLGSRLSRLVAVFVSFSLVLVVERSFCFAPSSFRRGFFFR